MADLIAQVEADAIEQEAAMLQVLSPWILWESIVFPGRQSSRSMKIK